jgi:hypothetical protein
MLSLLFNQGAETDVTAAGVAANAAIGAGSIDVDFVLVGVAAAAAIGSGTLTGAAVAVQSGGGGGVRRPARVPRGPGIAVRAREVLISASGVCAHSKIGNGEIETVLDLTDEEIMMLLLAA